jgi:5-methylcytosine-specific restriction endonuclease McrA
MPSGNIYKDRAIAVQNRLYAIYKWGAKKRDYAFDLTKEEFSSIVYSRCHYCNRLPSNIFLFEETEYHYNGIDRVNNDLGYVSGNVVACCKRCNQAKNNMGYKEFRELVRDIYSHWAGVNDAEL